MDTLKTDAAFEKYEVGGHVKSKGGSFMPPIGWEHRRIKFSKPQLWLEQTNIDDWIWSHYMAISPEI